MKARPPTLALVLALLLTPSACASSVETVCDLVICDKVCRSAGYLAGSCQSQICHCNYDLNSNSGFNPWDIPDAVDLCGGCSAGSLCCDSMCLDVENDPTNCGSCGRVCGEGEVCVNGWCSCGGLSSCIPELEKCCADACVNIQYDPTNCGDCGVACQADTGPECIDAQCVCPVLNGNARPCAGTNEDLCCARSFITAGGCFDLGNDREHCGSCQFSCSVFDGEVCVFGACTPPLIP